MPDKQKSSSAGQGSKSGKQSDSGQGNQSKKAGGSGTGTSQKRTQTGQDRGGMSDMKSSDKNK